MFITGYSYGLDLFEVAHKDILEEFNGFIQKKYNYYESTAGWKNMVLEQCQGNETLAFDTFMKLFNEYIIQQNISL